MKFRKYIKIILGWRNWSVFTFNAFVENIFIAFYIAIVLEDFSYKFIIKLLIFYLFSVFSTSYGYLINDISDKKLDALHNKANALSEVSNTLAAWIVLSVFLFSALFSTPFWGNEVFLYLWLIWLLLSTSYSLKPFRLKEKGKIGLLVVVFAQRFLPTLLVFAAFDFYQWQDVLLFSIYTLLRGLSSDVNHQLEDYNLDISTSTGTFAVKKGYEKTERLLNIILEAEKFFLLMVLIRICFILHNFHQPLFKFMILFSLFYSILYLYTFIQIKEGENRNPFRRDIKNVFQFIHHPFPTIILPLILCLYLIGYNYFYIIVLFLFLFNKKIFSPSTLKTNYLSRIFIKLFKLKT